MVPARPVLRPLTWSNETVWNAPKHEVWVQWSGSGAFIAINFDATSFSELRALKALVQPVLHRLSCSNETVQNTPKHEFWVHRSGSRAFVAKTSDATLLCELVC
jgi:hypothetical protein